MNKQSTSLKIKAVTKQLPRISQLRVAKDTIEIIKNKSNNQFYKWPSSYQSVTYCYQRDIRTQKSSIINQTSNFTSDQAVTSQLPTVTKRYKDTKIINIKSNIQFYKWPSSYQSVTYCYQRDIRTQKSSKINPTSNFTVTKQLPVSYLLLPKRYKDTKIINIKSNIQFFTSDQAVTSELPTVTKEI